MSLLDTILSAAGEGVHQAWRPVAYANQQDQHAGSWLAGEALRQQMQNLHAAGAPITPADSQLMQTQQTQGNRALWDAAMAGHPFAKFLIQTGYSPSTMLTLGAGLAPETAGAKALLEGGVEAPSVLRGAMPVLRGGLAGPAAEPWARGIVSLLNAPQTMADASALGRVGLVARAGERTMALPFEAMLSALRQSKEGSLLRNIPAFDHLFQLTGESMSKIAARNLGNWINHAESSGVPLRRILGLGENPELPGFDGNIPTGPAGPPPTPRNPGAVDQTLLPGVTQNPNGAVRVGVGHVPAPAREAAPAAGLVRQPGLPIGSGGAVSTIVGQERPAAMTAVEQQLHDLYTQLADTSLSEAEHSGIWDQITRLEGGSAGIPGDGLTTRLDELNQQMHDARTAEDFNAAFDAREKLLHGDVSGNDATAGPAGDTSASGGQPAAAEPVPQPEAAGQAVPSAVAEPPVAAPEPPFDPHAPMPWEAPAATVDPATARDQVLNWIDAHIAHAFARGENGQINGVDNIHGLLNRAGLDNSEIPSIMRRLFGGVLPGKEGYRGTMDMGYGKIADLRNAMRAAANPAEAEALRGKLAQAEHEFTHYVLNNQTHGRLADLLEYAHSRAYNTAVPDAKAAMDAHFLGDGLQALDKPEDIKLRLQHQYGVRDATVGGASGADVVPGTPLFQRLAGEDRPIQHPDIALPDAVVNGLRGYAPQLADALSQYAEDMKAVRAILDPAIRDHPRLGDLHAGTAADAVEKLRGVIPDAAHQDLMKIVGKWNSMGVDILRASEHQAVGVATMIKVAHQLAPDIFRPRGGPEKFLRSTLPSVWKQQALLAPRFIGGNVLDIVTKSLMHGRMPFAGLDYRLAGGASEADTLGGRVADRLRRTPEGMVGSIPQGVRDFAQKLDIPVPVDISDTFREAQVGDPQAFTTAGKKAEGSTLNPVRLVNRANLSLNQAVEGSGRTAMWRATVKQELQQRGPQAVAKLLARLDPEISPATTDTIMRFFKGQNFEVSAEDARSVLRENGVRERVVKDFTKHWSNMLYDISDKGVEASNHIHFDYAQRNNLDKFVAHIMPFHFWASRNLPFYMEHLAEHPALASAWQRYNTIAEDERQRQHLPSRFKGFLNLGGDGIVGGLFGVPGMLGLDPSALLSVTGQINPGTSFNREGESGLGKGLDTLKQWTGLGPGPLADAGLNVTGAYGKAPMDPSITRLGPIIDALSHKIGAPSLVPDHMLANVENKTRGVIRGWDGNSLTGSQYRDRLIRQRIAELAVEQGHGPNDPKYVMAMNNTHDPIWQQAAGQVERQQAAQNLLSSIIPLPTKYGTDTANQVQAAKDQLPPVPAGLTSQQFQLFDQLLQAQQPQAFALAHANDAVAPMGSGPSMEELKKEMVLYEQLKGFTATMPKSEASKVTTAFFREFPLLSAYFGWSASEKNRGQPPASGQGFDQFLTQQQQTANP